MSTAVTQADLQAVIEKLNELEATMQRIITLSGAGNITSAEHNITKMRVTMSEAIMLSNRLFILLRRSGLPEDVTEAITQLQRMTTVAYGLYVAVNLLVASTGPVGLAVGGLGVITSLFYTMDAIGSYV